MVDINLYPEQLAAEEIERLQKICAILSTTLAIPRRLSQASSTELALDKKRARRTLHACSKSLAAWGGEEREPTDKEKISGAQLIWELFWDEGIAWLENRVRYVATWGKQASEQKFAKSSIVKLENELRWLKFAMRD